MMAHLAGQQDDPELLMDINTSPLIDVMLVLLIMFIVTIPLQPHATRLVLSSGAAVLVAEPKAVTIRITSDDRIEVNGAPMASKDDFEHALTALAVPVGEAPTLHVDVHADARYEQVAGVLAQIQRNGLRKISMVGLDRFSAP